MSEASMILNNAAAMERALTRIAHEIAERNENSAEVALVGIHRGGVFLARRLAEILSRIWSLTVPMGSMDIGMHRAIRVLGIKYFPPRWECPLGNRHHRVKASG